MTGLTTHVLDTMHGRPAAGVSVRLLRDGAAVASGLTNIDGRLDSPLLSGDAFRAGRYRLEFDIGEYYREMGVTLAEPAFLDTVGIDFGVSDTGAPCHVPLLVSPFAYSTCRGG